MISRSLRFKAKWPAASTFQRWETSMHCSQDPIKLKGNLRWCCLHIWACFFFWSLLGMLNWESIRCILAVGKVFPNHYIKAAACYSFHYIAFIVICSERRKVNETARVIARRLLYAWSPTRAGRTYKGQRLFTSSWNHTFPLSFQFPTQLTDKPHFSERSLSWQIKQVPKQNGQKNTILPQKYPHLLSFPKECLLVCVHMPSESRVNRNVSFWVLERAAIPYPSLFFCLILSIFLSPKRNSGTSSLNLNPIWNFLEAFMFQSNKTTRVHI